MTTEEMKFTKQTLLNGAVMELTGDELIELLNDRVQTVTEDGENFWMTHDYEEIVERTAKYEIELESTLPAADDGEPMLVIRIIDCSVWYPMY